jgi:hypothetical protein
MPTPQQYIRYQLSNRWVLFRSMAPFTGPPLDGQADCTLDDAPLPAPVEQCRLTAELTALEIDPARIPAAGPDVPGFLTWLKTNMSLTLRKKASKEYPWLLHGLLLHHWDLVEDNLADAKTNAVLNLTANQWTALRTAAVSTYKLPVTLP